MFEETVFNREAMELFRLLPPRLPRVNAACLEIKPRRPWSKRIGKIRKKWKDEADEIINEALQRKYGTLRY